MKSESVTKMLSLILLLIAISLASTAQIATPEGQIQGGGNKDTGHFVDKPSMLAHEETIVIEKKSKAKGKTEANKNSQAQTDTAQPTPAAQTAADTTPNPNASGANGSGTMTTATATETTFTPSQDSMSAIYAALTTLGIGALIGLLLLVMMFRNQKTSKLMALLHGSLGLIGIGILTAYCILFHGLVVAVVILAIAATGGLIVFYKDISGQPIPKWLVATHGIIAVAGIIVLIVFAIGK